MQACCSPHSSSSAGRQGTYLPISAWNGGCPMRKKEENAMQRATGVCSIVLYDLHTTQINRGPMAMRMMNCFVHARNNGARRLTVSHHAVLTLQRSPASRAASDVGIRRCIYYVLVEHCGRAMAAKKEKRDKNTTRCMYTPANVCTYAIEPQRIPKRTPSTAYILP